MKEIKLTQGKIALVDDADFEELSKHKWFAHKQYSGYYATTVEAKGINTPMHRFILGVKDPKINVDHKDRNTLNNQRLNLRLCTDSQNGANRKLSSNNTSGFNGVCWAKTKKKWKSAIQFQGKVLHIGYYSNKEDAARAYDLKALELFGEFARLNFP